jgi:putative transposase
VVGWATAPHLRTELPLAALEMAIARRQPSAGVIHHSDHGSQFLSESFAERARRAGIVLSMGARRSAYDNAVVESFFATLKREWLLTRFLTRAHARAAIAEWIETFYNPERRHSHLGYVSPIEFELKDRDDPEPTRVR